LTHSHLTPGVQFEIEFAIILLQLFLAAHLFSSYWMLLGHYEPPGETKGWSLFSLMLRDVKDIERCCK